MADLGRCKEAVEELTELVLEFGAVYQAKKKERHLIDFSDMEAVDREHYMSVRWSFPTVGAMSGRRL